MRQIQTNVMISSGHNGFHHVRIESIGGEGKECLDVATLIYNSLTGGRLHFVRTKPEFMEDVDYDTQIVRRKASARFSFKDEKGEERISEEPRIAYGFGDLKCK